MKKAVKKFIGALTYQWVGNTEIWRYQVVTLKLQSQQTSTNSIEKKVFLRGWARPPVGKLFFRFNALMDRCKCD